MARRDLEEINAGSMADIAFLLLIFFLVTTTMDVDAGIGRTLPLKQDEKIERPPIDIRDRDILEINCNSNDQLLVENKRTSIEDLEEIVWDYYTSNIDDPSGMSNPNMPTYNQINIPKCQGEITKLQTAVEEHPEDIFFKTELGKWETKMKLCQELPTKSYSEISSMAIIRLGNQAGTSYGLYIQIQNILKKVVNELRIEHCEKLWGRDYFSLDQKDPKDQDIIKKLRILVPERIVEAKIER